jgi:hypothetical protein
MLSCLVRIAHALSAAFERLVIDLYLRFPQPLHGKRSRTFAGVT